MQAESPLQRPSWWTGISVNIGNPNVYKGAVALLIAIGIYLFANSNEARMGTFLVIGLRQWVCLTTHTLMLC